MIDNKADSLIPIETNYDLPSGQESKILLWKNTTVNIIHQVKPGIHCSCVPSIRLNSLHIYK